MSQADPGKYVWWLAGRASGIVALALITTSVLLGLVMAGRIARRPGLSRALVRVHEHTALTGLVAIAVHGITLLGDNWLNPGVAGITIPFAMTYRPVFTGLGILGGYLAAVLGLSYYARRQIGPRRWRRLHRLTVVVFALGLVHTFGAGTDAATPWMQAFMAIATFSVAALFLIRLTTPSRRRTVRTGRPAQGHPAAGDTQHQSVRGAAMGSAREPTRTATGRLISSGNRFEFALSAATSGNSRSVDRLPSRDRRPSGNVPREV